MRLSHSASPTPPPIRVPPLHLGRDTCTRTRRRRRLPAVGADEIQSTWATRELPILQAALRRLDVGDDFPELEEIRQEVGVSPRQLRVAVTALRDAGYIDVLFTGGWTEEHASGNVSAVHERARRELGSWPSPDDVVDQLIAALTKAAEEAGEPERMGRLRSAAEALGGIGRDIAVRVIADRLGRL